MKERTSTYVKRSQKDYSLGLKHQIVQEIESGGPFHYRRLPEVWDSGTQYGGGMVKKIR
jgi:hypothetical protein